MRRCFNSVLWYSPTDASINRLNITLSFLITQLIGLGLYFVRGNVSWRLLFGLQFVPSIVLLIGSFWVAESPRWLCLKGRNAEALNTVRRLHGWAGVSEDEADSQHYKEYTQIRAQIEEEKTYTSSWHAIFSRPSYLKRFALICGFFFFQQ